MGTLKILEFQCGACEGTLYLCQHGTLIATYIYKDPQLNIPSKVKIGFEDIHKTDFAEKEFDIIIYSQVLEQLVDLPQAFREIKRISIDDAYFVFSIQTATWLIFSIPAKIFKKLENILLRLRRYSQTFHTKSPYSISREKTTSEKIIRPKNKKTIKRFLMGVHGCYPQFIESLKAFRIRNWRKVMNSNGSTIIKENPLLFRGDSYFSLFPQAILLQEWV